MEKIFWSLRQNVHGALQEAKMRWERICLAEPATKEDRIEELDAIEAKLRGVLDDIKSLREEAEASEA